MRVSAADAGAGWRLAVRIRMLSPGFRARLSRQRQRAERRCGWPSERPVIKWAGRGNFETSVWLVGAGWLAARMAD